MSRVALSESNLADSILATGSIPMVLSGVSDIAGAPPGIYRDGGVIDYHLELDTGEKIRPIQAHFLEVFPGSQANLDLISV